MISKNLAQRIAVAVVAIPAILFMAFRGGDTFLYFVLLLAAIGIYEYLHDSGYRIFSLPFMVIFLGAIGSVWFIATGMDAYGRIMLVIAFLLTGMIQAVGKEPTDRLFSRLTYLAWGLVYIGLLWPCVYLIRGKAAWMTPAPGQWWVFFLLGSLWLGDTAAMFFGSNFGKHKLAPSVSPHKTIEGFIGGFIGIFLVAILFKLVWLKEVEVIHFLALSILIGLVGQLGDLAESLWKRSLGIKDSSSIIPGHGGVLDRFDSLLFSSPIVYFYLKYILHAAWM
ncbi:MAG: phosphatidate cytidylyltransferase [candidate division Zixibacteria bacterium]|nr:phosphatidate cytidylyltransferase [candidate division Zixibacteria bacterium]